jgi:hypothetical protein
MEVLHASLLTLRRFQVWRRWCSTMPPPTLRFRVAVVSDSHAAGDSPIPIARGSSNSSTYVCAVVVLLLVLCMLLVHSRRCRSGGDSLPARSLARGR